MSTSVDLGIGDEASIRVMFDGDRLEFMAEFARNCFQTGPFRSRTGDMNSWQLDCRESIGAGAYAQAIAAELILDAGGILQFVGSGFGAYILLGAILGVHGDGVTGALVRPARKAYGRERLIEGAICPGERVCVVDDILNSGETACRIVRVLRDEGVQNISYVCVFRYRWGTGVARLAQQGVDCRWLAEVVQLKHKSTARPKRRSLVRFWHFLSTQAECVQERFKT
ncbi:MAG: phosphoribosyltransferase family protein [Fuerstiella sp.]|nr:hypothetical protein [Fuerstiella sp.]